MSGNSKLAELPPELLEYILSFLDGRSVIILRSISKESETIVDEALAGKIGQKFWLRRCFLESPRVLVMKALASFQGIIGARNHSLDQEDERALGHKWRRIYVSLRQFRRKFGEPVEVWRLTRAQNMLKNEMTIAFYRRNTSATYPYRMESTSGSTLFHVQCPCTSREDQEHLYFFEDMTTYRRGLQLVTGREKIRSVYSVLLPFGASPTCFDPSLLKVSVLCVILTAGHILLAPLHQGKAIQISLLMSSMYADFPNLPAESRFGIWGHYIGVWLDPDTIRIYKILVDPMTGDVTLEGVKHIAMVQGRLHAFWRAVSARPVSYLPVLRNDFQNPFKSFRHSRIPSFSMLSPTTESFTVYDDHGDSDDPEKAIEGRVEFFRPKMTPDNVFTPLLGTGGFTRRKSEQNVVVFFNTAWIAVLFRNDTWIYQNVVPSPLSEHEQLLDLECQTENFFIFGTNLHIFLVRLEYVPPAPVHMNNAMYWSRGQIRLEVIRKIPLATFLPDPRLSLLHCHFDMDRGKPYIFLSFDLPIEHRTAYTFELMKLEFKSTEEEMDEEFGHLKDEGPWASDEFAAPISSDVVMTLSDTNPRMAALFAAFGIK